MIKPWLIGAGLCMALTGCAQLSDSRINPFNWFGDSSAETTAAEDTFDERRPLVPADRLVTVVDNRPLVSSVTALSIDRTASGAIVRATGLAAGAGYFNAQLVAVPAGPGVLSLEFRAEAPDTAPAVTSTASREITVAYIIDENDLLGIRTVEVRSAQNVRTSRR